jgi:hypothetical protein
VGVECDTYLDYVQEERGCGGGCGDESQSGAFSGLVEKNAHEGNHD